MPPQVRPLYLPPVFQDGVTAGRVVLRDGTTANLRIACPADCPTLVTFFQRLSEESTRRRFFSASRPTPDWVRTICDSSDLRSVLTLIVTRSADGVERVIGTGSYLPASAPATAEVAFAVADDFRGKGLGTLLLERLALVAVRHGIRHFWAVTQADNQAMADVFRESGFEVREELTGAYLA